MTTDANSCIEGFTRNNKDTSEAHNDKCFVLYHREKCDKASFFIHQRIQVSSERLSPAAYLLI